MVALLPPQNPLRPPAVLAEYRTGECGRFLTNEELERVATYRSEPRAVAGGRRLALSRRAVIITYPQTSNVTHNIPRFALHRLLCIPPIAAARLMITGVNYTRAYTQTHATTLYRRRNKHIHHPSCLPFPLAFFAPEEDKYPHNRKSCSV